MYGVGGAKYALRRLGVMAQAFTLSLIEVIAAFSLISNCGSAYATFD